MVSSSSLLQLSPNTGSGRLLATGEVIKGMGTFDHLGDSSLLHAVAKTCVVRDLGTNLLSF